MSVQDVAMRKFYSQCDSTNPLSHRIVDVDCVFEGGKFIMRSLPADLPSLFTIRFTAPEDFTQGNVVVIQGKELPVRTPNMVNASSGLFAAGAVMHCDVDLDREIAFFWQNGNGAVGSVLPNLSYEESFAGFYYKGDKVYFKLLDLGMPPTNSTKYVQHDIANIKEQVNMIINRGGTYFGDTSAIWGYFNASYIRIITTKAVEGKMVATLYYTCTDR